MQVNYFWRSSFKYALALFLSLSGFKAFADFETNIDFCFISKSSIFEYEGAPASLVFQMAVEEYEGIGLPIINLAFPSDLKIKSARLFWQDPKILSSNNNPIFERDFYLQVNQSDKIFHLYKSSGDIFYSPYYGYLDWKIFMSLFLSQAEMSLELEIEGGEKLKTDISLSGSDQSVRDLAVACFPDLSSDYLNEYGSRKKTLHESWQKGYGLVHYPGVSLGEDLIYDIKNEDANNVVKSYEFFKKIYPLSVQRKNLVEAIVEVEQTSNLGNDLKKMKEEMAKISKLNQDLILLEGHSSKPASQGEIGGQIADTESEISKIESEIQKLKVQVSELKSGPMSEINEELDLLNESNSEKLEELNDYEEKIASLQSQIEQTDQNLKSIEEIYHLSAPKLESAKLDQVFNSKPSDMVPLSLEALQEESQKVSDQELDLAVLRVLLEDLLRIKEDLAVLNTQYQRSVADYQKYLEVKSEITDLKGQQGNLQSEIYQILSSQHFIDLETLSKANNELESQQDLARRTVEEDKSLIIANLRSANTDYDNVIDSIKESVVTHFILCRSNSLSVKPKPHCLTPNDLKSEKAIEVYFSEVTTFDLDEMILSTTTLFHSFPWRNEEGLNKREVLVEHLAVEVAALGPSLKELQILWDKILVLRWRYSRIKHQENDLMVDAKFYKGEVSAFKKQISDKRKQIQSLSKSIDQKNRQLPGLRQSYLDKELDYQNNRQEWVGLVQSSLANLDLEDAEISDCLNPLLNLQDCSAQYENYVEKAQIRQEEVQISFNQNVEALVRNLIFQMKGLEGSLLSHNEDLDQTKENLQDFKVSSNIEELLQEQKELESKKQELQLRVEDLESALRDNQVQKESFVERKSHLQEQRQNILQEMEALKISFEPLRQRLEAYCDENKALYDQAYKINEEVIALGGVLNAVGLEAKTCQFLEDMVWND